MVWHPPSINHSSVCWHTVQCTAVCQKPGAGAHWCGSSQQHGPSGWGQVLACARTCPLAHWMWTPTSPSWRYPCPESHSQYCSDYPAIISLGYLLLFLFVSGIRLSENILIGRQKSFTFLPDCSLIESDKWPYTSHGTENMDFRWHAAAFRFTIFSRVWLMFLWLTIWFVYNKKFRLIITCVLLIC